MSTVTEAEALVAQGKIRDGHALAQGRASPNQLCSDDLGLDEGEFPGSSLKATCITSPRQPSLMPTASELGRRPGNGAGAALRQTGQDIQQEPDRPLHFQPADDGSGVDVAGGLHRQGDVGELVYALGMVVPHIASAAAARAAGPTRPSSSA